MTKKRGSIGNGLKAAYHAHQAFEAVQSVTASKVREFLEGVGEFVIMVASLAIVCGLFWLANYAIHAFKNSIL